MNRAGRAGEDMKRAAKGKRVTATAQTETLDHNNSLHPDILFSTQTNYPEVSLTFLSFRLQSLPLGE